MKTIAFVVFSCSISAIFIFHFSFCFSQWQWQNPLPQGNDLNDVFFIDQYTGWAVGDAGTIIKSADGGATYEMTVFPTHLNLYSVEFYNPETGLAAGQSGLILKTSDGGLHWTKVEAGFTENFTGLCIKNEGQAWSTGDNGSIIKSSDYGETWQVQFSDTTMQFNSLCFTDEVHGWAAGRYDNYPGVMLRTDDGGNTWINLEISFIVPVLDVCFTDSMNGWASLSYEEEYCLYRTYDGGEAWVNVGDISGEYFDICFTDGDHGWIAGDNNYIPVPGARVYYTDDGGSTWNEGEFHGYNTFGSFHSVYFTDNQHGWLVGSDGNLMWSSDGGQNWTIVCRDPYGYSALNDIFFTDESNGWAVGGSYYPGFSQVYHTSDGGNTWEGQEASHNVFNSVFFIDPLEGWMAGGGAVSNFVTVIQHTLDGGNSWETQFSLDENYGTLMDLFFTDDEHGWAVGTGGNTYPPPFNCLFYYTGDGGDSWIDHSYLSDKSLSAVYFSDADHGWVAGHETIMRTIDGGQTWSETWEGPHYLRDIFFIDGYHGWAVGDSASYYPNRDVIMRTTDGGITWEEQYPGLTSYHKKLFFTDYNRGWIARDGDILFTVDGGITWEHMYINTNLTLGAIFFTDVDNGWVAGSNDAIFHINNGSIVGLEEDQFIFQRSKFKVVVYPNPTHGISHFAFHISQDQWISLKIYDVYGREMAVVMDGRWPGDQVVSWDAGGLPTGIYFYQLRAKGEGLEETGKILKH